jgi:hypothetical protein
MNKPQPKTIQLEIDNGTTDYSIAIKLLWTVFIFYSIAVLYGLTFHEPWRDEAQGWLLVRDTNITNLLKILPTEGHPPLWYFIIMPLVKTGLPYISQNVLTAIIMIAAMYILQFKTQMSLLLKFAIPFSFYFFYEYALFARSYCLLTLLVAAIIALYPRRFEKKWLFTACIISLFNTHILVFSFCFAIAILYLIDAVQFKKLNASTAACIVLMFAAGLCLISYLGHNEMIEYFQKHNPPTIKRMIILINDRILNTRKYELGIFILLFLIIPLSTRPKALILLLGSLVVPVYINGFIYKTSERHLGILIILLIAAYAIAPYYSMIKKVFKQDAIKFGIWLLAIVLIAEVPKAFESYENDRDGLYSDAENAAEFIKTNHLEQSVIVADPAYAAGSILPYLNKNTRFYYSECQYYGSYFKYDSCYRSNDYEQAVDYAVKTGHDNFKDKVGQLVFVLNKKVLPVSAKFLDLLYATPEPTIETGESFYIYKFKKEVR